MGKSFLDVVRNETDPPADIEDAEDLGSEQVGQQGSPAVEGGVLEENIILPQVVADRRRAFIIDDFPHQPPAFWPANRRLRASNGDCTSPAIRSV